jgi:hypothetical protein
MTALTVNFATAIVAIAASFALLAAYALAIEPYNLQRTENRFDIFDGSGEKVKIVLISDTQAAYDHTDYFKKVVATVNSLDADYILIAGDIVDSEPDGWNRIGELANLKARYGKFAVLGNHDYRDWSCDEESYEYADRIERTVESLGITVLRNENRILSATGERFALVGVDDSWACRSDYPKATEGVPQNLPKVIIVHNNLALEGENLGPEDIVLAGHTHCGQVYVPFITDYLVEDLGFGKTRSGKATLQNGAQLYVTCGVTPGGIRLFARPEISVIYLE